MTPSVFLRPGFLDVLENFSGSVSRFEVDHRIENKNQLVEILSESDIITDISDKEVIKLAKKSGASYDPTTWFEFVLLRAYKNHRLSIGQLDPTESRQIFLLDKNSTEVLSICEQNNVLCEGLDYDFLEGISPRSNASIVVDKNMNGVEIVRHRCKNVIIIDPYFFAPIGSQVHNVPRIPNVVKLLKELFFDNVNPNLHLSILYHRDSESRKDIIEGKINEISAGLGNPPNLQISAFGHEDNLFESNRHVITDYSIMDLQHPFDRDNSSFSINFLFDKDIRMSFQRVRAIIDIAKKSYNSCGPSIGVQKVKFGNMLDNKLFK